MKFPEVVTFRITSECNNNCHFCYGPKNIPSLNLHQIKKMFSLFAKEGVKAVVITGGEPMKYPVIDTVLRTLKKHNFKVFLDSNSYYFFDHKEIVTACVDVLGLPLDYPSRSPSYRSSKNFDQIIKVLEYYKELDKEVKRPKIRIGTVITKENSGQISLLGELLKNYPIDTWKLYQFIPVGKIASKYQEELLIGEDEYLREAYFIASRFKKYFDVIISPRKSRSNAYFLINPDGTVIMPDDNGLVCWESSIGNVFEKNITQKWHEAVLNGNYLENAGHTFSYKWDSYPMEPIYNRIWQASRRYLSEGQSYTEAHVEWLLSKALDIKKYEKIDEEIFLPLIILHDVGYSFAKKNPFRDDTRQSHMKAGAMISRDILRQVRYPRKKAAQITKMISIHDVWALGDHSPYLKNKEMALFNDLDFISMATPSSFSDMARLLKKQPGEMLGHLKENEKLSNRPFACETTGKLFESKITQKTYELSI